ncbi:hypothetical protein BsWGS_22111 [Bradybaena similaris]
MTTNSSPDLQPSPGTNYPFQKRREQRAEVERIEVERFLPVEYMCSSCGKRAYNMKACTKCWWTKYCNRACQRNHWARHRHECREDVTRSQYYKGGRVVEVAMAYDEGQLEAFCNEDALFLNLEQCPKNGYNDHANFIAVKDMTLDKLPMEIQRQDVLDYIMSQCMMTVSGVWRLVL